MRKAWFDFLNAVNKNVRAGFVPALIFFSFYSTAFAAEDETVLLSLPELSTQVVQKNETGNQYQLGDRIRLYVEISNDALQGQTSFTVKPPESGSKIEEQGWYIDPQTLLISNNLQFVVSPIRAGKLTLPTLIIAKEDKTSVARTSPFTIDVPAMQGKAEPSQLIDPVAISLATKYWVLLIALSLLVALVSIYFIRRYLNRKRKVKPATLPVVKKDPEHVIALRALDSLYKKVPYSNDNLKVTAFGISEILKHFFSERFQIDATESTTDEMIILLRNESIPSEGLREVLNLFQDLDFIKFTKAQDYSKFNEQHYLEFKIKAQSLIQKWAHRTEGSEI